MTGRELEDKIIRTGQERAARKLALSEGLITAEKLATMTGIEVYNKLAEKFELVGVTEDGERIMLVRKEDEKKLWGMVECLDR